ncbi:hypothetical protein SLA2020_478090 [Shorea laevis]
MKHMFSKHATGFFIEELKQRPLKTHENAVAQDIQNQEEARQEDEAEQADSALDPHAHRQHYQVQCEAQALASYKAWILRCSAVTDVEQASEVFDCLI